MTNLSPTLSIRERLASKSYLLFLVPVAFYIFSAYFEETPKVFVIYIINAALICVWAVFFRETIIHTQNSKKRYEAFLEDLKRVGKITGIGEAILHFERGGDLEGLKAKFKINSGKAIANLMNDEEV